MLREPPGAKVRTLGAERIAGATVWRILFLAIQGGSSVLLFAVLAHVLGRSAFAAAAVAQGVLVIAQALGDFGFSQAAVTVLPARIAAAPEQGPAMVSSAAAAYLWASAAALALTVAAAGVVPGPATLPVALAAPAAAAMVAVSGADGILRAQGKFRRPVLLMTMSEVGGFAAIPVAAATGSAAWTCAALSLGTVLGSVGAVSVLLRMWRAGAGGNRTVRSGTTMRSFVRASLPLGLAQVTIVLATRIDTLVAGALSGLLAAAAFESAWRIYQIGQYMAGAFATAAAPFVADAIGGRRHGDAIQMLRRLLRRLLVVGVLLGAGIYLLRTQLAHVLAGPLAARVESVLPILALLSPLAAVGLVAFFTLLAHEGERRYVLAVHAAGAVFNLALAAALAPAMGVRGVVIGCATGLALINVLLLARLATVLRTMRAGQPTGAAVDLAERFG